MQTALITGASSGIGLELAKIFAADKINVVLVARSQDKLKQQAAALEQQFGITAYVLAKDLSNNNAPTEIYEWCKQQGIGIDYLVNNAGFGDFGFFAESNWKVQDEMIQLNVTALTQLTHLFLPAMKQRRFGRIMNVASTAAFQPGPLMSVYFATKAFVLHFSEAIANELKGTGVTVTALYPGATASGFQAMAKMEDSRLIKGKKIPSSKEVAAYGYKAMQKGKAVAIHGIMNYILANGIRFAPRNLVVKIARHIQDKV